MFNTQLADKLLLAGKIATMTFMYGAKVNHALLDPRAYALAINQKDN